MAWRPYENLMDGELDNRTPGKVTGWIRFHRFGKQPLKVRLDLSGDFHEDIRGKVIRLSNPHSSDRNQTLGREGTYVESISPVQRGEAGDITAGLSLGTWTDGLARRFMADHEQRWEQAGLPASERKKERRTLARLFRERIREQELYYPYSTYPYIEWYSETNGRVVLELDPSQVEIVGSEVQPKDQATGPACFAEQMLVDTVKRAVENAGFENDREVGIPPSAMANQ